MKNLTKLTIAAIAVLASATLAARTIVDPADSTKKIKAGWNFGPLPAISYSTDLGLQLGALCDIYYYGDGSTYPEYLHKLNVEASYYMKGQGVFHLFYDSKHLIPGGVRVTAAATYFTNKKYSFFGFNGASAPYYGFEMSKYKSGQDSFPQVVTDAGGDIDSNKEAGIAFYNYQRNTVRVLADFSGPIYKNLRWAAGVSFWDYMIDDINGKWLLNEERGAKKGKTWMNYDPSQTLYRKYVDNGIIKENEAKGGMCFDVKAGFIYDTRDIESAPNKGIWAEAYVNGSFDVTPGREDRYNYAKLCLHWRHYISLVPDKLVFAYHLAYQGTIAGKAPFYTQQMISTLYLKQNNYEGLGSINTVRGTLYNRMIGDGYAWGNLEFRWKIVHFNFIKQNWYFAVNPFFDAGMVVQPYRVEEIDRAVANLNDMGRAYALAGNDEEARRCYDDSKLIRNGALTGHTDNDALHMSAGLGLKLCMNNNFIIAVEAAKAFRRQDGNLGFRVGLNYIF